jgi:hypothetical protein
MNMPLRRVSETMWPELALQVHFLHTGEIVDTGGGTPQVLESLSTCQWGVIEKQKTKSTTGVYSFLGVCDPAFLSGVIMFMSKCSSRR